MIPKLGHHPATLGGLGRLRVLASRAFCYVRRLRYWTVIVRSVRGRTTEDRKTVLRAFLLCPISALRNLDAWQDPRLAEEACVDVRGVGAFRLRADSDDLHHVIPAAEPEVFRTVRTRLKPGDVFVDAGANIGMYTVLASRLVGPAGRVLAIEMLPETAARLRLNIVLNGLSNVEVVEAALSGVRGQVATARFSRGKFGQASLVSAAGGETARIRTEDLTTILAGTDRVALMKMDLEGAELLALQGAGAALDRIDAVIYECLSSEDRVRPWLEQRGFVVKRLNSRQLLGTRP